MIKIISLDVQGTLTESDFSDYFWLELLPKKYSEKFNIQIDEAKKVLKDKFNDYGIYNLKYYDDKYWGKYLKFDTLKELNELPIRPKINNELLDLILNINVPKIIISTTTNIFIEYELGDKIKYFDNVYSCVDYFNIGGKTKEVYKKVCSELGVLPSEVLHIGDSKTMDIENAFNSGVNAIYYDGNIENLKKELKIYVEV